MNTRSFSAVPPTGKFRRVDAFIAAKFPSPRHNDDILSINGGQECRGKEGSLLGLIDCCRYEASLDELIDDEVMAPVLRSAGLDAQGFRNLIVETARRFDGGHADDRRANR